MAEKKTESNPADEVGAKQVQSVFDEANEKGYFGETPDDEPRDSFTLKGVAGKKP